MNAVYKSKTRTGNARVNNRDVGVMLASISAMRLSVRRRTSSFSFSIFACECESGGGRGFRTISVFM